MKTVLEEFRATIGNFVEDDDIQEALLRIDRKLHAYDPAKGTFGMWIGGFIRVTRRIERRRRAKRERTVSIDEMQTARDGAFEDAAERIDDLQVANAGPMLADLRKVLSLLNAGIPKDRVDLLLVTADGVTTKDAIIELELDIKEANARQRLCRTREDASTILQAAGWT